jgi:hypothetical protein
MADNRTHLGIRSDKKNDLADGWQPRDCDIMDGSLLDVQSVDNSPRRGSPRGGRELHSSLLVVLGCLVLREV